MKPAVRRAIRSSSTPFGERLAAGVHPQDALAAVEVGLGDDDLPVEPAGAQQRRVEDVGPVGGRDDDDAALDVEAVQLDEQLVEGLLALVVAAAEPGAAVPADRVDLVHEHDRGRVRLGLLEQVTHPGGADADEHLHEVGTGDRVERDPGLPGHGAGEEGLAGARRAVEQHALGDLGADRLELARGLQELLDLLQFLDGLVGAGHVGEGRLRGVLGDQLGLGLPEVHHPGAAALHLVEQEEEDQDDQDVGQEAEDHADDGVAAGHLDVVAAVRGLLLKFRGKLLALVADPARLEPLAGVAVRDDLDRLVLVDQGGRLDVAPVDVGDNPGRGGRGIRDAAVRVGEHDEEQQQHHEDRDERPAEVTLEIH